ncbi:hypothetical protein Lalb_Chr16g0387201 [Lupinus albus]|uniref:Uncharacterized protein n=1 Tax=Lupinus albus TaxID=3870 RepID=A0A6A4NYC8_LUPAL|nr:hypothetical protein Lalb_Chr16g0387201 [Lupinus albus]
MIGVVALRLRLHDRDTEGIFSHSSSEFFLIISWTWSLVGGEAAGVGNNSGAEISYVNMLLLEKEVDPPHLLRILLRDEDDDEFLLSLLDRGVGVLLTNEYHRNRLGLPNYRFRNL